MNNIKFMWNGIKIDGKLYRCWYSDGKLVNHPEGTLTIYAKGYESLPVIEGLTAHNDSDIMTDYFEKDRIRVTPDSKYYQAIKEAIAKYDEHTANKKSVQKNRVKTEQRAARIQTMIYGSALQIVT